MAVAISPRSISFHTDRRGNEQATSGSSPGTTGETEPVTERFLCVIPALSSQWYEPLRDQQALFRRFGDTPPTEAGIREFATQYGLLTQPDVVVSSGMETLRGERLELWQAEIVSMKHALRLWDALRAKEFAKLERWAREVEDGYPFGVRYFPDQPYWEGVDKVSPTLKKSEEVNSLCSLNDWGSDHPARLRTQPVSSDGVTRALALLRSIIDNRILDHVGLSLLHHRESPRAIPLALYLTPRNLIGALWFQFANAIEGDLRYQRCSVCHAWFFVPAKARKDNTVYCSVRCRVRSHRGRKEEVVRLAGKGMAVGEIRKRVDSEPSSIRRWVAQVALAQKVKRTKTSPARRGDGTKKRASGRGSTVRR